MLNVTCYLYLKIFVAYLSLFLRKTCKWLKRTLDSFDFRTIRILELMNSIIFDMVFTPDERINDGRTNELTSNERSDGRPIGMKILDTKSTCRLPSEILLDTSTNQIMPPPRWFITQMIHKQLAILQCHRANLQCQRANLQRKCAKLRPNYKRRFAPPYK